MSFLAQKWKRIPVALMVACSVAISGCASTGSSMLGKGVRPDPRLTRATTQSSSVSLAWRLA